MHPKKITVPYKSCKNSHHSFIWEHQPPLSKSFRLTREFSEAIKHMKSVGMKGSRQTRHSKVYTSRGPRDRRVRLSAVTAIQFYDVQDRLGFDRPSEAVDWLMLKAKASIDALNRKQNVQPYGCDSVNNVGSFPEFNYNAVESFPFMGSQESVLAQEEKEFVPSSCLDQVVFSASLFSKKTSPVKRNVLSSASSMEDAARNHRVVEWPLIPPTIEFRSSFQIGE